MYQLIIFGPPGVGKGTQAEILTKKLELFHFSTGEFLRKAIEDGSELGKKAKEIVESGKLVPDEIMIEIVDDALHKNLTNNGFILDGFPRTKEQAEALDKMFEKSGFFDVKVIYLTADEDEIVTRLLKRGRTDDTEETIRKRLRIYKDSTEPVLEYYRKKNCVTEFNGVGDIEDINSRLIDYLKKN